MLGPRIPGLVFGIPPRGWYLIVEVTGTVNYPSRDWNDLG